MTVPTLLPRAFYARQADVVARDLLGCVLERRLDGRRLAARIVETEAYVGSHDAASHSRAGVTLRTAPMFGPPGRTYVYFVYGMHWLLNVVTGPEGSGQAVLLRGAEPVAGVSARMDGPGRLARTLAVDGHLNDADLCLHDGPLTIVAGAPPATVAASPRVGVDYAGAWRDAPLRFFVPGSPGVSRPR